MVMETRHFKTRSEHIAWVAQQKGWQPLTELGTRASSPAIAADAGEDARAPSCKADK